ncbi:arsenate reductase (glutaredoxin) [Jhaorihella thermophila]
MIELWHNPRCSKSRAALALLKERGAEVKVRRYLDEPPTEDEIRAARAALGNPPAIEMMRPGGKKRFRELGLNKSDDDDTLIAAMAAHPILIERPLAIRDGKAVIGRPPEKRPVTPLRETSPRPLHLARKYSGEREGQRPSHPLCAFGATDSVRLWRNGQRPSHRSDRPRRSDTRVHPPTDV